MKSELALLLPPLNWPGSNLTARDHFNHTLPLAFELLQDVHTSLWKSHSNLCYVIYVASPNISLHYNCMKADD